MKYLRNIFLLLCLIGIKIKGMESEDNPLIESVMSSRTKQLCHIMGMEFINQNAPSMSEGNAQLIISDITKRSDDLTSFIANLKRYQPGLEKFEKDLIISQAYIEKLFEKDVNARKFISRENVLIASLIAYQICQSGLGNDTGQLLYANVLTCALMVYDYFYVSNKNIFRQGMINTYLYYTIYLTFKEFLFHLNK